jgi:hypothetical protein
MSFLDFAISVAQNYYDLVSIIRSSSYGNYNSPIFSGTIPVSQNIPAHEETCFHRQIQTEERCYKTPCRNYQKSLLMKINQDIKGLEAKAEENIQEAFSRKIKSRRWYKRHHFV